MTRFTQKEKVVLGLAKSQAGTIRSPGTKGFGFLDSIRRSFRRAAIMRQLSRLDDRMLADIGLQRWQIDTVANEAVCGQSAIAQNGPGLFASLRVAFANWLMRRKAHKELMALDERMLTDIGITRADIPAVVASLRTDPTGGALSETIGGLRLWNRSRQAAKTLHALDGRTLNDIGFVRGDIDWVAEELAIRSLVPANRNNAPKAA